MELPKEIESFFKFLKINPTAADLKGAFAEAGYLHKDIVAERDDIISPIFAKNYAIMNRKIKKVFGDYVELTSDVLKNEDGSERPPNDVLEYISEKLAPMLNGGNDEVEALKKELEKAKKGGNQNEEVERLQSELEKTNQKYLDINQLLEGTKKEYDEFKHSVTQKQFEDKKNTYITQELEKVKLKVGVPKIALTGLKTELLSFHNIIEEDGVMVLRDKDGKRIKHPEHANQFASLSDLAIQKAKEEGIFEDNEHSGKPAGVRTTDVPPAQRTEGKPKRTINYGANIHKENIV